MTPEQISEWWESVFEDEWDDSLWYFGFSLIERVDDYPADRMAMLAEQRWCNGAGRSGRLWDPQWGAVASARLPNRRSLALIRSRMPRMLAQWKRRQARKARAS